MRLTKESFYFVTKLFEGKNKFYVIYGFLSYSSDRIIPTMKCILILLVLKASIVLCKHDLHLMSFKEWNELDFNFPSKQSRQEAIDKGWFISNKAFPLDVDVDYQGLFGSNMIEYFLSISFIYFMKKSKVTRESLLQYQDFLKEYP